jgi:hypothetical protein
MTTLPQSHSQVRRRNSRWTQKEAVVSRVGELFANRDSSAVTERRTAADGSAVVSPAVEPRWSSIGRLFGEASQVARRPVVGCCRGRVGRNRAVVTRYGARVGRHGLRIRRSGACVGRCGATRWRLPRTRCKLSSTRRTIVDAALDVGGNHAVPWARVGTLMSDPRAP